MYPKKIYNVTTHEALITKQGENNVNRVKWVFYVYAGRINSRSTITYMKSEIFVLTRASRNVICYVHFFTSLPLSDYLPFYTVSIHAYILYLIYIILLILLFCLRIHKT
jgi:hypothetical protein